MVEPVIPRGVEDFAASSCYFVHSTRQGLAGNRLLVYKGASVWTATVQDPAPKGICRILCYLRPPIFVHQKPLVAAQRKLENGSRVMVSRLKFGDFGGRNGGLPSHASLATPLAADAVILATTAVIVGIASP